MSSGTAVRKEGAKRLAEPVSLADHGKFADPESTAGADYVSRLQSGPRFPRSAVLVSRVAQLVDVRSNIKNPALRKVGE